jgi:molybdopterin synthase sulfur carrier subunit
MAFVKLFGYLRNYKNISNSQIAGASVRVVLEILCESNPTLCDALFENGAIRKHFKITLNGHDIALAKGLDTPVCDEDRIAIFPPIAGG